MANEATLVYETEQPIPMEVANGTGIEKGAILMLSDPMTAATATGDGDIVAGIAAEEKIANDGKTKIAVYRGGIFKGVSNGGSSAGDALMTYAGTGGANDIATAAVATAAGAGLGIALETATNDETFLFELRPGVSVET